MSTHALEMNQLLTQTLDNLDAVDMLYREVDRMINELPAGVRMPKTVAELLTLTGNDEVADPAGSITPMDDLPF